MTEFQEPESASEGNSLGVIGFILSLTCCLAPLGLVLSLLALKSNPKTFAILGVVFGIPFSVVGVVLIALMVKQEKLGYLVNDEVGLGTETYLESIYINGVASGQAQSGPFPASGTDLTIAPKYLLDGNDRPYRLVQVKDRQGQTLFQVTSCGSDGVFDTEDDLAIPPSSQVTPIEPPTPDDEEDK